MKSPPILTTERLILRQPDLQDAKEIKRLAGDKEIAATTTNIPHPYEDGMAEYFINKCKEDFLDNKGLVLAITLKENKSLIGMIGLTLNPEFSSAEMGYWVGKEYWNKGYCSEAAKAMLNFAFDELKLNRVHAHHFANNPSSGKVMQKIGMKYEGTLREHIFKDGKFIDIATYGIIKSDLENSSN